METMNKFEIYSLPSSRKAIRNVKNEKTGRFEKIEYDKQITLYFYKLNLLTGSISSKKFGTKAACFNSLYEIVTGHPSVLAEVGLPDIETIDIIPA